MCVTKDKDVVEHQVEYLYLQVCQRLVSTGDVRNPGPSRRGVSGWLPGHVAGPLGQAALRCPVPVKSTSQFPRSGRQHRPYQAKAPTCDARAATDGGCGRIGARDAAAASTTLIPKSSAVSRWVCT